MGWKAHATNFSAARASDAALNPQHSTLNLRPSSTTCCFDLRDVDFPHFHHRLKGALGLRTTCGDRADEDTRSNLPGQSPAILAPATGAFLATITDDRVPVAVGFLLRVGRDLKGERLAVPKSRPAVKAETGNTENGEFHCEDVA